MELLNQIVLAFIQGITEFLPISSSGHLALFQNWIGEVDVSLIVFLHLATLLAVIVYFFRDIRNIVIKLFTFDKEDEDFKLAVFIIIGTIPAVIAGLIIMPYIYAYFSNLLFIGAGFIISGLFLFNASLVDKRRDNRLNFKSTFVIGLSQALAILPGISRSGSTASTGILFGLSKEKALRFSFLLSIPIVFGAFLLDINDLSFTPMMLVPFFVAFVFGIASIHIFMKVIKTRNLKYFAYYCWLLALISFVILLL